MYPLSAAFLILSGTAALTYQVSWVRLLGLSMGSTSAAISTVLAAFFLGMALGSFSAERITKNRINNLTPYIVLEAIIAVSGLILLPVLLNLDHVVSSFGQAGTLLSTKFFLTMALLLVPTVCMGATFPVMASILVRRHDEIGVRVSQLYSLNTLGAVFGAVLSGFWFIPQYGLDGAIYIAVGLNLLIVTIGIYINRHLRLPPLETETEQADDNFIDFPDSARKLALVTLFATGFVSIATEVGWTKYLSIFTGTTIYGFAAILAIFLLGISFGSWAVKYHIHRITDPISWLATGLASLALILLVTRGGLSLVPSLYEAINHMSINDGSKHLIKYFIIFLLLFPSTVLLGAIFPINLRLYCGSLSGVRQHVGKAYSVNTVASILGSLAAGFWLIPYHGTDVMLTTMAFVVLLVALFFLLLDFKPTHKAIVVAIAALVLINHFIWPHIDYRDMIASVDYEFDEDALAGREPKFLFLKEGKVSVISLVSYDDHYAKVQANGLNESVIDLQDESNSLAIESLLAYMPYFLHKDPKKAFIVGFGGGITTRAFTHTDIESIRVVELEPTVVDAGRSIKNGPAKALDDPRVTLQFNDARNTLLIEDVKYDIISAQASHPWLAGASNVFTQEFFEIVRSRLNDGGYYSQWVNLFRMDVTTLRAIFKSFLNVFPNVVSMANIESGDLMLIGSLEKIEYDYDQVGKRMSTEKIAQALKHFDIYGPRDLLWYFALSQNELEQATGNAIPNLDTNILSEVRLSSLSHKLSDEDDPYAFLAENYHADLKDFIKDKLGLADKLYDLGEGFLLWEYPDNTKKLAVQLETISAPHAVSLKHKTLYWQHNYSEATRLFESKQRHLDVSVIDQLSIYYHDRDENKARKSLETLKDDKVKYTAGWKYAFLFDKKITIDAKGKNADGEMWQYAHELRAGNDSNVKRLRDLMEDNEPPLAVLRTVSSYLLNSKNPESADRYISYLNDKIKDEVRRYTFLVDTAIKDKNAVWAEELLAAIERLSPQDKNLSQLKQRLEASIL